MKKFIFALIAAAGAACCAAACARRDEVPLTQTRVYYADATMMRLLPYTEEIIDADTEHMAQAVADKLIECRNGSDNVRRLLPNKKECLSVSVKADVAYVDISSEAADELPKSRDTEKLVIYQIVNSLTELKGVRFVKFTVDGKENRSFMGFYDMRETYKYTYPE